MPACRHIVEERPLKNLKLAILLFSSAKGDPAWSGYPHLAAMGYRKKTSKIGSHSFRASLKTPIEQCAGNWEG
jgi:hypothetical protein